MVSKIHRPSGCRCRRRRSALEHASGGLLRRRGLWNGLRDIGYVPSDIPELVKGTLPQHCVTKLSPQPAGAEELAGIFESALVAWQGAFVEQRG
jgi:hypothetical protein